MNNFGFPQEPDANIRQFGKMIYMCCGDFVDTCSAITEKNGVYCLEKY